MKEDERRSDTNALVSDAKPTHLDGVHGHLLADRIRPYPRAEKAGYSTDRRSDPNDGSGADSRHS